MNVQEIKERWSKATRGPWVADMRPVATECGECGEYAYEVPGVIRRKSDGCGIVDVQESEKQNENAAAIASAPTDIAFLLAEVERLNRMVDKACAIIDGCPGFNTMDSSGNGNWFCGEKDCMRSKGPYTDCWRKYLQEGEAD